MQRRCVFEGVKEIFIIYRQLKWKQVQSCINTITGTSRSPTTDLRIVPEDSDDSDTDSSFSDDEMPFQELMMVSSDSENDDDQSEEDVFWSTGSDDKVTLTRALCADNCAQHRGV